ncbi:(R)-specific enoyl-CoA hydratase [Morus notabilis]|uniref:(R)-specific enoyl-CoA hydratase n=1 Tax=Morus notabilis TaxID=981085 RepID=W9RN50_9ROSA|nr:uncharacterized protein LOC21397556 [Morus notabilis]XP_024026380.1 uncharacterized protein LOC21397556 [Morus notabilis]EXB98571.1 (R)-specific enoyl-CoA hydratase [Morus notabilis]
MLIRNLLSSSHIPSLRCFSSSAPCLLKVGDTLKQTRTFADEDLMEYAKVTYDSNPIHFDSEAARNAGFEDRLVHGTLVASMIPHIISSHFPGAVYLSQSVHFKLPVYIGEEIAAEMEAINIRANKKRYIAKLKIRCFKNGELLVLDGEAMAILPSLVVEQVHR